MLALSVLIASQSHTVHAESIGKGKPMVAIPGGPGFSGRAVWAVGFGMREGVKTYLFDQLGTGKNQPKGEMQISLDGTIEDLEALRKQAGHKKWIVFGQSWGVIVALVYAARHPQAIDSLVLTSIPGIGPESWVLSQNLQREIPESVSNDLTKIELDPDLTEEEKLTLQVPAVLPYYFYNHQQGKNFLDKAPPNLFSPKVFAALQRHIKGTEAYYSDLLKLKKSKFPVTLIQGHQDPCGAAMPFFLKRDFLPQANIRMLPNCGHFPWVETPDLFFDAFHNALKLKPAPWLEGSYVNEKAIADEDELRRKNNWPFGPN